MLGKKVSRNLWLAEKLLKEGVVWIDNLSHKATVLAQTEQIDNKVAS